MSNYNKLENLIVFDIETIPDADAGRRLLKLGSDINDADVIKAMEDYHLEITDGKNSFLRQPFHKVIAISILRANLEEEKGFEHYSIDSITTLAIDKMTEAEIIATFFNGCAKRRPRFITYNGRVFDFPVLKYRAMANNVQSRWFYTAGDKWVNYSHRWSTDWNCDVIELLNDFGASSNVKMSEVSALFGIPCKIQGEGNEVLNMFNNGEVQKIKDYCETDVIATYLIYLKAMLHRGRISFKSYNSMIEDLQTKLLDKPYKSDFEEFFAK